MKRDNKGKVAVVTGVSGGMGQAISLRLAEMGVDICGIAVRGKGTDELSKKVLALGAKFEIYKADVSDHDSVAEVMETIFNKYGRIDILINVAGVGVLNRLEDLTSEDIHRTIDINLKGTIFCTKQVIPYMSKTGGNIINVSSMSGVRGIPDPVNSNGVYTASKFGVNGFSECMEKYLLQYGIYVTTFCPGATATAWWDTWEHSFGKDKMIPAEYIADVVELILNTPEGVLFKQLRVLPAAEADLF